MSSARCREVAGQLGVPYEAVSPWGRRLLLLLVPLGLALRGLGGGSCPAPRRAAAAPRCFCRHGRAPQHPICPPPPPAAGAGVCSGAREAHAAPGAPGGGPRRAARRQPHWCGASAGCQQQRSVCCRPSIPPALAHNARVRCPPLPPCRAQAGAAAQVLRQKAHGEAAGTVVVPPPGRSRALRLPRARWAALSSACLQSAPAACPPPPAALHCTATVPACGTAPRCGCACRPSSPRASRQSTWKCSHGPPTRAAPRARRRRRARSARRGAAQRAPPRCCRRRRRAGRRSERVFMLLCCCVGRGCLVKCWAVPLPAARCGRPHPPPLQPLWPHTPAHLLPTPCAPLAWPSPPAAWERRRRLQWTTRRCCRARCRRRSARSAGGHGRIGSC